MRRGAAASAAAKLCDAPPAAAWCRQQSARAGPGVRISARSGAGSRIVRCQEATPPPLRRWKRALHALSGARATANFARLMRRVPRCASGLAAAGIATSGGRADGSHCTAGRTVAPRRRAALRSSTPRCAQAGVAAAFHRFSADRNAARRGHNANKRLPGGGRCRDTAPRGAERAPARPQDGAPCRQRPKACTPTPSRAPEALCS